MTNPSDASTSDPVISLRNVSMSYGSRRVLDGVDLDVYRGEILVLLGGSGSGKSTLLKHVLGLTKPDGGNIRINGVDIISCDPSELAAIRRRIGVAFQASALFNSLSVADNVALPLQELTRLADFGFTGKFAGEIILRSDEISTEISFDGFGLSKKEQRQPVSSTCTPRPRAPLMIRLRSLT